MPPKSDTHQVPKKPATHTADGNGSTNAASSSGSSKQTSVQKKESASNNGRHLPASSAGSIEPLYEGAPTIFSIGHSNCTIDEFLSHLADHHITTLIDVRSTPASRFNPQFTREPFEKALTSSPAEVEYIWMKELGGREEQFGNLEERLRSNEQVIAGMAALLDKASSKIAAGKGYCAFMCSEGDWRECHRQYLASYFVENKMANVLHVLRDSKLQQHPIGHKAVIKKHEVAKKKLAAEGKLPMTTTTTTTSGSASDPVVATKPSLDQFPNLLGGGATLTPNGKQEVTATAPATSGTVSGKKKGDGKKRGRLQ